MALVSIPQAARELGCTPEHIRRKIKAGQWPHYKFGGKMLRVDTEELREMARLTAMTQQQKRKPSAE